MIYNPVSDEQAANLIAFHLGVTVSRFGEGVAYHLPDATAECNFNSVGKLVYLRVEREALSTPVRPVGDQSLMATLALVLNGGAALLTQVAG